MGDKVKVEITPDNVREFLRVVFKDEHKERMTNAIVGVLEDDPDKLGVVFKASLGMLPPIKYKKGDRVICNYHALDSWQFDKDAMRSNGMIRDEMMLVTIKEVKEFRPEPYTVSYTYMEHGKKHTKSTKVIADYLHGLAEELPGD